MMSLMLAALLIVIAGAAIGATSIGGVLIVPALTIFAGIPVTTAIAASSFGFLLTGAWGWRKQREERSEALRSQTALHVAALLGAIAGALLVREAPASWVRGWIAVLAIASGAHALATAHRTAPSRSVQPSTGALIVIGTAVGIGSALSGTGGPVLLLPILLLYGVPAATAVATALAIQLPIAIAASGVHVGTGALDLRLGAGVGLALIAGASIGHRIAAKADALTLRRGIALVLIAIGLWYGFN